MTRPKRQPPRPASCACSVNPQDLGEIKGKLDMVLDNQKTHGTRLETMDGRLRKVETKTAVVSAGMGAAASLLMSVCMEFVRNTLRRN